MTWCCFNVSWMRKNDLSHIQQESGGFSPGKNIKLFSYKELISATNNFHPSNKIGRGGFGTVFKGTLSGTKVAVKILSAESKQGNKEFLTEINVITNVRHQNLVKLFGCCIQDNHRILVYEYVENNSLDHALLGPHSNPSKLDWSKRAEICLGTARGLTFLHDELEPHVVHRDIKASNILLDGNFAPKIGDFGLAKLFPDDITHITTRVAGTTGYLAPEYAMGGRLTKKADIYSFGILILEIVSGRSSAEAAWSGREKFVLESAWQLYGEGKLIELVDPHLKEYPEEEVLRYIKVALFCTQGAVERRPSMSQVLEMLSKRIHLNEKELAPPGLLEGMPGIYGGSKATSSNKSHIDYSSSTNCTVPVSSAGMSFITEIIPR